MDCPVCRMVLPHCIAFVPGLPNLNRENLYVRSDIAGRRNRP